MASSLWPLQVFDGTAPFTIIERRLPHWSQPGTVTFITWRTQDSIPQPVLRRWHADRDAWLRRHGIEPTSPDWREQFERLKPSVRGDFVRTFAERWHRHLDACHGACVLRQPALAQIVADSLHKFDGERYEITDFIVMPNHVHLLAAFPTEEAMLEQCEGWKHYQARELNRRLGGAGRFWQQDGFDHLVRSVEQFEALRHYIAANPRKAHLRPGEYHHYSKPL
jgi:putative transposase